MLNSVLLFLEQTSVLHLEQANVLHSVPSGWISGANGDVNSSNCHGSGGHGSSRWRRIVHDVAGRLDGRDLGGGVPTTIWTVDAKSASDDVL